MRTLGAILAGGRSRRFGSDKALATWRGSTLIERVLAALRPHVDAVVICGRDWPEEFSLADRPAPDLGPLGGLNAALAHGLANDFDRVLSAPCDVPTITPLLLRQLNTCDGPAVIGDLPVIGMWPTALAPRLDCYLAKGGSRSVTAWARACGAVALSVAHAGLPRNINRPEDLDRLDD